LKDTTQILVDDREKSLPVRQALAAMEEVSLQVRRLAAGDFQVDGRLLFERKTLSDFAVSVIDGRFFRQMAQLAMSPLKGALILEGNGRDLQDTGIRREALQGALISASLMMGIPVLRALTPEETARLMVYAARQMRVVAAGGLPRSGYRPKGKKKRQLYILQSLPGVGPARAARLLERFGNVRNVFNANLENLKTVDGIGADTARKIQWAISETKTAYGSDAAMLFQL